MLFDTWAGVLSPAQFHRHVIEPAQTIVDALRQRHPAVPIIGFPRLAGLLIGDYATATGVDGVGLDTSMDLRATPRNGAGAAWRCRAISIRWRWLPAERRCGRKPARSWLRCGGGRACSISATASCRRHRPSMSPRWWSRCVRA